MNMRYLQILDLHMNLVLIVEGHLFSHDYFK